MFIEYKKKFDIFIEDIEKWRLNFTTYFWFLWLKDFGTV